MAYVTVPKDLDRVKNKVVFNLTMRQVVCLGLAAAIGAPFYFAARDVLGASNAATGMVALMLPVFFFAQYEKDGLPLEKVLMNMVSVKFIRPAERRYTKTDGGKYGKGRQKLPQPKTMTKRKKRSKMLMDDDKIETGTKAAESGIVEEINVDTPDERKQEVMVLSFEKTDGAAKDRAISEEHILKEMAGSLNGMDDGHVIFETKGNAGNKGESVVISEDEMPEENVEVSEAVIEEERLDDIFKPSNNIEEQPQPVLYEPLTTQEAYLNSLLENLGGGGR